MSCDDDSLIVLEDTGVSVEVQVADYIVLIAVGVQPDLSKAGSACQVAVGLGAVPGIRVCRRPWQEQTKMIRRREVAMRLVTRVLRDVRTRKVRKSESGRRG